MKKLRSCIKASALVLMLSACTHTADPIPHGIVTEFGATENYAHASSNLVEANAGEPWWITIGGTELDQLTGALISESLLLQEARLQAVQALEREKQASGQRLPSVSASSDLAANRTQDFNGNFAWSEVLGFGLVGSFDPDIFGGLRSAERSAALNTAAAELSLRATVQREIAALARNWVAGATLTRRLELAQTTADSFRSTYVFSDERYRSGSQGTSASDVQIALQNLESSLADIPDLQTQLARQLLVIDEQLGRLPGTTQLTFEGCCDLMKPFSPPIGQPVDLLATRPDVAAAELRYRAALEDVSSSRANLYPGLSLTASLNFQGEDIEDAFDWDRHVASLSSSILAPLFQGGRLKSQVRLAEAQAEELSSAFARSLLAAVIDVESVLIELNGLQEEIALLRSAAATAALSNQISVERYRQGLSSILAVQETQRSLNNAQLNLILAEQALLNAQIDLLFSLGGTWDGTTAPRQFGTATNEEKNP
jgi:NodT family efflux transporter outer membrane factor (OMF) lipoprotein